MILNNKNILMLSLLILLCGFHPANAWRTHFLITYAALKNMPEVSKKPSVRAETLTAFVEKESEGLVTVLKEIDHWPTSYLESYPPACPESLTFRGKNDFSRPLLEQFTDHLRINPAMHYDTLFVEYAPDEVHRIKNPLSKENIVLAKIINDPVFPSPPLEKVNPGGFVSPFEIITSAVDEPDFGMDIDLWEDSGTAYGRAYKLGHLPFGNKKLAVATQAPFHMGFFYQDSATYYAASFLKRAYAEYRIHSFLTLSKFAFATGHSYWGYRFLGWSLHYLQDLGQPYHSTLAPNVWDSTLILKNAVGGYFRQNLIQELTNKHLVLENYQYHLLKNEMENNPVKSYFIQTLSDLVNDVFYQKHYDDLYPRTLVAKESYDEANTIDTLIVNAFQSYVGSDSNFDTVDSATDLFSVVNQQEDKISLLNRELQVLFRALGSHTRIMTRYALSNN